MTWYLHILAVQEPFDLGLDGNGKAQSVFNITTRKRPSDTFVDEIAKRLEDQGVGSINVDIFATSQGDIPTDEGTYLSIAVTAGATSQDIHNEQAPAYPEPSAQIVARAVDYEVAEAKAFLAYHALAGVRNTNLFP